MPSSVESLPIRPDAPWLAPLAGFSDLPFRLLCRQYGASVACTEMVSARGLIHGLQRRRTPLSVETEGIIKNSGGSLGCSEIPVNCATASLLNTVPADAPLVVQLFGSEPDVMGEAAGLLRSWGFQWLDCNMGCSVPKVTKTGAGAALLRDPALAVEVARALVNAAGEGRVGCKLRLGWNMNEQVYLELAKALEDVGVAWITLHPRYARQLFSGTIDEGALEKLVRAVNIPVIASGDLLTAEDAVQRVQRTGVSGVMFARGAMSNPAIFLQYREMLKGREAPNPIPADMLYSMIIQHVEFAREAASIAIGKKGAQAALMKMRTVIPRYIRHLPGARHIRQQLVQCSEWDDFLALVNMFFTQLEGQRQREEK